MGMRMALKLHAQAKLVRTETAKESAPARASIGSEGTDSCYRSHEKAQGA